MPLADKVLLISMPFGSVARPSLALSLLKGSLEQHGIAAETAYLNVRFAALIGKSVYESIGESDPTRLIGEWLFASSLFDDGPQADGPPPPEVFEGGTADIGPGELQTVREAVPRFLDRCMEATDWESFAMVGFTSSFQQNVASLALARRVKERYPRVPIVLGGANCEGEMGLALHRLFPFLDYVCLGEGEVALPELARRIVSGKAVGEVPGMIGPSSRASGGRAPPAAPVVDLDQLPFPDFTDFIAQARAADLGREPPQLLFESARGCWWGQKSHCTFCGLNGERMRFRAKSPRRTLEEIEWLVARHGAAHVQVVDNIMEMRYFKEVLPGLAARDLGVSFFFETKANLRREQVAALAEAGVTHIQPGIESLSTRVLRRMRKGVSALQNIQLLKWCAEFGVHPHWNLLAGFPGEEPADYRRQAEIVELLTHLTPPTGVGLVNLQRFSPLFERAEEHGIENVRPARAYGAVYPFAEEDLSAIAYCFDFDYADRRVPGSYLGELRRAVERWVDGKAAGSLRSHEEGDALVIRDSRPVAVRREYRLVAARRIVHDFCDRARTAAAVEEHLASSAPAEAVPRAVPTILAELVSARLVLCEDDQYLSLAVPFDRDRAVRQFGRALRMPRLYELWAEQRAAPAP